MKKVNFTIDIFKFIFAVIIVLNHANVFLSYPIAIRGSLGVEFFFIVSGYLMAQRAEKANFSSIGESTYQFLKKKYFSIFPFFITAIVTSLAFCAIASSWSLSTLLNKALYSIPELLWLQMFGFSQIHYPTGVAWYLSAMLIAMAIFYPLLLKYKKSVHFIIAPLTVLFTYGIIWNKYTHLASPGLWLGFCYKGVFKGIAGIALGIICYALAEKLSSKPFSKSGRILLTLVEYSSWALAIFLMFYMKKSSRIDFFIVGLLFIAVTICFSETSLITTFINKFNVPFFRKASMCIFLNNYFVATCMPKILPNEENRLICYLLIVCALSVFNYFAATIFIKLKTKAVLY